MGGHGALTLYLNSVLSGRKQYRSASAFAPISNPTKCPWGEKAFKNYLEGGLEEAKDKYDATELIRKTNKEPLHILIDYVGHQNCASHGREGCLPGLGNRARATTFTSKASSSQRISSRQRATLATTKCRCESAAKRATTIATISYVFQSACSVILRPC